MRRTVSVTRKQGHLDPKRLTKMDIHIAYDPEQLGEEKSAEIWSAVAGLLHVLLTKAEVKKFMRDLWRASQPTAKEKKRATSSK